MNLLKGFLGSAEKALLAAEERLSNNEAVPGRENRKATQDERRARILNSTVFERPTNHSHELILNGFSDAEAEEFFFALKRELEHTRRLKGSMSDALHKLLKNTLHNGEKPHLDKIFQMRDERTHELCSERALAYGKADQTSLSLMRAHLSGITLEFCYRKFLPNGKRVFSMKRVLATKVREGWFQGVSFNGVRNYSFNGVFSATVLEHGGLSPLIHPSRIAITTLETSGKAHVLLYFKSGSAVAASSKAL